MPISCVPADLSQAAKCFVGMDQDSYRATVIYLLAQRAGLGDQTAAQLSAASKCYAGLDKEQFEAIEIYLLCQLAS